MRLTDSVDITTYNLSEGPWGTTETATSRGTYRAQISYRAVGSNTSDVGGKAYYEEIRVMLDPLPYDPATMKITWLGNTYKPTGPAEQYTRNGRVHHITIPVKLNT